MRSLELFSGAGGLALGIARAGFEHLAVVEWDRSACQTLEFNQQIRRIPEISHWPVLRKDVRSLDYRAFPEDIELIAGGVPCQPFSIGGKHRGHLDERNMFPELVRAIRILKPKAVLVENVRGLARPSFSKYFGYIELMLAYPELSRKASESWTDHVSRLERYHTRGRREGLYYRVVHRVLNAADYGTPQKRERLFMVAIRADLGIEWAFPAATHSYEALLFSQFCSGEYWDRHGIRRPKLSDAVLAKIKNLQDLLLPPPYAPWRT